jgi:hypothetical protein
MTPLSVLAAYIPNEMRERRAWVVWRMEDRDGRPTKVPYACEGAGTAKSNDPSTWSSWTVALMTYGASEWSGMGYMLAGGDVTCIDLDHCIVDGVIEPWAQAIVDKVDSYTEKSQGGDGLHIFVRGTPPAGRRRKGTVEMYGPDDNRYIAVTGQRLDLDHASVNDCDLTALHAELFPYDEPVTAFYTESETDRSSQTMTDDEIYTLAHRAKNAGKLAMLVQGDWGAWGNDPSAARMALISILAFYTQDVDQLVRMAGQNGFDRPDDERKMRNHDIPNALSTLRETYQRPSQGIGRIGAITPRDEQHQEHSFKLASEVEPQDVDWLWEPWLPYGMLTMLDGDPGIGKSFLALEIAARISVGSPMPPLSIQHDAVPRRGVVLVMPEDDNAKTIIPRLIALGADRSRIVVISKMFDASAEDGIAWLEEAANAVDACLVVFDPLLTYLGGEKSDTHKDRDVRRALDPIIEMAIRRNMAILGNRHLSKGSKDSSALYRGMGSIGIVAVARVGLIAARNPEEGKGGNVLAVSKCNLAPKPKSLTWIIEPVEGGRKNLARVVWTGDTLLDADQLATGPERHAVSLQGDVEDAINLYLAEHDGSAPNREMIEYLHETHGWSEAVIMKWRSKMDNLENEWIKGKAGGGTVWRFKDGMEP